MPRGEKTKHKKETIFNNKFNKDFKNSPHFKIFKILILKKKEKQRYQIQGTRKKINKKQLFQTKK